MNFLMRSLNQLLDRTVTVITLKKQLEKLSHDVNELNFAVSALAQVINSHSVIIRESALSKSSKNVSGVNVDLPDINPEKNGKPN
jgi:hypothetical protein